jgi:hypothetical protein
MRQGTIYVDALVPKAPIRPDGENSEWKQGKNSGLKHKLMPYKGEHGDSGRRRRHGYRAPPQKIPRSSATAHPKAIAGAVQGFSPTISSLVSSFLDAFNMITNRRWGRSSSRGLAVGLDRQ